MTARFRFSDAADDDVEDILAWSETNFGLDAHNRYLHLLEAAVAHAAESRDSLLLKPRPELGEGVLSWHISQSVLRAGASESGPHATSCTAVGKATFSRSAASCTNGWIPRCTSTRGPTGRSRFMRLSMRLSARNRDGSLCRSMRVATSDHAADMR